VWLVSQFEYITMLFSFVAAFGVSELLAGWARQYIDRRQSRLDPLQLFASVLVLMALLQSVWGSWTLRDTTWTFASFLLALSPFLPLAGAAALVHPPASAGPVVSLRAHYFSVNRALFFLIASWLVLGCVADLVMLEVVAPLGLGVRLLSIGILAMMVWSERPWVHWVGLGLLAGLLTLFVAAITPSLA
jgi:hypothetical protein